MSEQPKASTVISNATSEIAKKDPTAFNAPAPDWRASGRPLMPENEEAAKKLEEKFERLATTFNVKVDDKKNPLKYLEAPRRDGVRLHKDHLPGAPGPYEKGMIGAWKAQKRTKCNEPGCYYPINPKKLPEANFEPLVFKSDDDGEVIAGECSWEPRHAGGLQFIPVPRPEKDNE